MYENCCSNIDLIVYSPTNYYNTIYGCALVYIAQTTLILTTFFLKHKITKNIIFQNFLLSLKTDNVTLTKFIILIVNICFITQNVYVFSDFRNSTKMHVQHKIYRILMGNLERNTGRRPIYLQNINFYPFRISFDYIISYIQN